MSEEEELPLRMTNVELAKLVREQMAENRRMKEEMERLKNLVDKGGEEEHEEEETPREERLDPEEARMAKLLKAVKSGDSKTRTDLPMYEGKMDDEILLDWFSALENHFDCEDVEDKFKVKIAKSRLKGHALLWWDNLQVDRGKKGLPKITSWPRMMDKMKDKFLPDDYKVQLYKKMQGLKQKDMDVQKYTEEFHKLDIRAAHDEDVEEKVARYLGGLRYNIQDEMSMATPRTLEECYKLAMKAEDKLKRRQERQSGRKGQTNRGRGERFQESQEQKDKGKEQVSDQKNGQRGGGRLGQEEASKESATSVGRKDILSTSVQGERTMQRGLIKE